MSACTLSPGKAPSTKTTLPSSSCAIPCADRSRDSIVKTVLLIKLCCCAIYFLGKYDMGLTGVPRRRISKCRRGESASDSPKVATFWRSEERRVGKEGGG